MPPTAPKSKTEFYRHWFRDAFGNRPRTWDTIANLGASGYDGLVTMRTVGPAGGKTLYRLTVREAAKAALSWPGRPTYNESMPDERLTIQGEVSRIAPGGLYLRYDTTPNLKMQEAMKVAKDATGITAVTLLHRHLWPSSMDDLGTLLDHYPDAVVEFSAYDCAVGKFPHRNMVVWEIRRY